MSYVPVEEKKKWWILPITPPIRIKPPIRKPTPVIAPHPIVTHEKDIDVVLNRIERHLMNALMEIRRYRAKKRTISKSKSKVIVKPLWQG